MKKDKLKIDLDGKSRVRGFLFRLSILRDVWKKEGIKVKEIKVMETRKGFHITFYLNKLVDFREILLYRLLLGDDRNRCIFDIYNSEIANLENFTDLLFSSKVKYSIRMDKEGIYETEEVYTKECILIEDMVKEILKEVGLWVE